jgi:hypothetical protein
MGSPHREKFFGMPKFIEKLQTCQRVCGHPDSRIRRIDVSSIDDCRVFQ